MLIIVLGCFCSQSFAHEQDYSDKQEELYPMTGGELYFDFVLLCTTFYLLLDQPTALAKFAAFLCASKPMYDAVSLQNLPDGLGNILFGCWIGCWLSVFKRDLKI